MQNLTRHKESFAPCSKNYVFNLEYLWFGWDYPSICVLNLINPYQKPTRVLA